MTARLPIGLIQEVARLRRADDATVKALAASMAEVGLLNPITVQAGEVCTGGSFVDGYRLVAGANRLAAARALGWTEIEARVVDLSDMARQMAEIDENLCRAELTPAERAEWTAKRKRLHECLHGPAKARGANAANKAMGRDATANSADAFTTETAARSGQSERKVRLDAQRGERIAPDVMEKVKADPALNKGTVLDALARTPAAQQPAKLSEIAAARAKPRPVAVDRTTPEEAEDEAIRRVLATVNKWPEAWRVRLIEALLDREAPVFDR